jgi:hypothetical protein
MPSGELPVIYWDASAIISVLFNVVAAGGTAGGTREPQVHRPAFERAFPPYFQS